MQFRSNGPVNQSICEYLDEKGRSIGQNSFSTIFSRVMTNFEEKRKRRILMRELCCELVS